MSLGVVCEVVERGRVERGESVGRARRMLFH